MPYPTLSQTLGRWSIAVDVPFLGRVTLASGHCVIDWTRCAAALEAARRETASTTPTEREFWRDVQDKIRTCRHDKLACECDDCEAFRDEMRADGDGEKDGTGARDVWD